MKPSERLKNVRDSLGKSQTDMAGILGINYRTYQNYEVGRSDIGWDALSALAKLGFDANWLLTGEGEMKRGEVGTSAGQVLESAAGRMVQTQQCTPIRPEIAELVELLDNYANKTLLEDLKSKLLNIKKVMEG